MIVTTLVLEDRSEQDRVSASCMYYEYGEVSHTLFIPSNELTTYSISPSIIVDATAELDESVTALIKTVDNGLKSVTNIHHIRHQYVTEENELYCRVELQSDDIDYIAGHIIGVFTSSSDNENIEKQVRSDCKNVAVPEWRDTSLRELIPRLDSIETV